ncbi:hypothetical protein JCM14469_41940 [Desulfatiferula olefinivorans]
MDTIRRLEELYKTKYRLFLFIGRTHGLSPDASGDAVQTAFVKALGNSRRIESMSDSEARGYIVAIIRNECFNFYRSEKRYATAIMERHDDDNQAVSVMENVADLSLSPLDELIVREEKRLRDQAVMRLPEKYRQVVGLSLEGYKRRDIARLLGIDKTNIHNLKHRGMIHYYSIVETMGF